MKRVLVSVGLFVAFAADMSELDSARDRQDRVKLEQLAQQSSDPYRTALAYSYASEVALELGDKANAQKFAELGVKVAEPAAAKADSDAEWHRLLGTLCGQVIPAAPLVGLRYGRCAQANINRALELNPKSALSYVSHGVGNFYLPPALGGGVELALKDFLKAAELDPKLPDAQLWLGRTYLKLNREADARKAFELAVALNPNRVWAKQQLSKIAKP